MICFFEAGYGWAEAELDTADSDEDDAQAYYVQSTITFSTGVVDEKQDNTGAKEPEIVYFGLK
jgi:hypothetical protein